MSDVAPEPVQWLWPDRFALGKSSMILGDPDLGKSFVTLDMAARVSTGRPWPDRCDEPIPAGSVILLSAEDDPADTIRPRLDAACADASRIILLKMIRTYHEETGDVVERSFSLERDLETLKAVLRDVPDCRLIIIDPISAYLGSTDSHVNAKIRGLLAPLAQLAADHRVAVVCVTHLSKNAAGKAMYRAQGSLAFVAAARAVWLVVEDKENPTRRLMLPVKNNLAFERSGLAYSIQRNGDGMGVVHWENDPVTIRADDALTTESGCGSQRTTALAEAVAWLRDQLADGPKPAKTVKEAAEADGIAKRTLDRAKAELGVEATRDGFSGPWVWKLPDCHSAPTEPEERQPNSVAYYGEFGALCGGDPNPLPPDLPPIPDGWTPASWAVELERKANCCEELHPTIAADYRRQAATIRAGGYA
jgi:hypothetical protein